MNQAVKSIMLRELKAYLTQPIGLVFIIIFLTSLGHVTFEPGKGSFFVLGQADLSGFFRYIPWLFLVLVPAISMRLWSEERRTGTIELLLTLPITVSEAVIGKFLASWFFLGIVLLGTFPMIVTVLYLGSPDLGMIFWGHVGAFLLGGTFLAVGTFFSALTKSQVISFILSVVMSYLLLMFGSPPVLEFMSSLLPKYFVEIFESLSAMIHYENLGRGIVSMGDLWFFALMICGWLYGSILLLEERKAM